MLFYLQIDAIQISIFLWLSFYLPIWKKKHEKAIRRGTSEFFGKSEDHQNMIAYIWVSVVIKFPRLLKALRTEDSS